MVVAKSNRRKRQDAERGYASELLSRADAVDDPELRRPSRPAIRPSRRGLAAALNTLYVSWTSRPNMAKLRLRDRIQVVVYAYETGLIAPQGRRQAR